MSNTTYRFNHSVKELTFDTYSWGSFARANTVKGADGAWGRRSDAYAYAAELNARYPDRRFFVDSRVILPTYETGAVR